MSADKPTRASDRVRPDVVQALLDDPLDYSSYTIAECRVLQAELRRLNASEAALKRANDQDERFEREWYLRGDQLEAMEAERDHLRAEVMEQARLLGMSGERELALRAEIDRLRKDADRLDWLADPANIIGNVQLPRECVEQNLHSLRDAIDAARKLK